MKIRTSRVTDGQCYQYSGTPTCPAADGAVAGAQDDDDDDSFGL